MEGICYIWSSKEKFQQYMWATEGCGWSSWSTTWSSVSLWPSQRTQTAYTPVIQNMFYLTIIHACKVLCNLIIVIVENCLGVQEGRSALIETDLEEKILSAYEDREDLEYLDIMSRPPAPTTFLSKGQEIRSKLNRNFINIRNRNPSFDEEALDGGKSQKEIASELSAALEDLAFKPLDPDSLQLDFVIDGKVENIRTDQGDRVEYFTISIYLGRRLLRKIKRSLEEIRNFDNEVRRNVNYDMPNLSELSRRSFTFRSVG